MLLINNQENQIDYIDPFILEKGNIMLLFMPIGKDIKVCENILIKNAYVKYMPYWVEFTLEEINDKTIELINDHIAYLTPFLKISSLIHKQKLTKKDILNLSGVEIRIMNLFIKRHLRNIDFFEMNIARLSVDSIKLLFEFLIKELEDSNYNATYLVIESIVDYSIEQNPVLINKNEIDYIFDTFYKTNLNENFKIRK